MDTWPYPLKSSTSSNQQIEIDLLIERKQKRDNSPSEYINPMTLTDEAKRDSRVNDKMIFWKHGDDSFSFKDSNETSKFIITSEDFNSRVSDEVLAWI